MNYFKNLKTRAKLLLGFGSIVVLLGITILVAYRAITTIVESQRNFFEHEFVGVVALVEMRADLNGQRARIAEMLLLPNRTEQEALSRSIQIRAKEVDDSLQQLGLYYTGHAAIAAKLAELKSALAAYRINRDKQIELILEGKADEAKAGTAGVLFQQFEKIRSLAVELGADLQAQARGQMMSFTRLAAVSTRTFAVLGVLALLVGLVTTATLTRLIGRPLVEIAHVAERMAAGDLTVSLATDRREDEVGGLIHSFRRMAENLRNQIRELAEGANVLGASASEIVAATTQLAASASESAAAVSETTTTVEEVRQTAEVASQKARNVADSAQKAAQSSQQGRRSNDDVVAGMNRIRQQMEAIAGSMGRLSEQSQAIGQIIATVEDLAAQSNLLAVNAAIEAAKAGEHGKGFGVVAQEVKSLAEQSRQATTQVRTILNDIQKATTTAVLATEQGSKAVEAGTRQTEVAGESIRALATSVGEAAQAATQIAASSQQQLVGVDQVAGAMENIKQASTQNVASARQLEIAARDLSELGQRLKQMVGKYKV